MPLYSINDLNVYENTIRTRIKMLEFNELLTLDFDDDFDALVT